MIAELDGGWKGTTIWWKMTAYYVVVLNTKDVNSNPCCYFSSRKSVLAANLCSTVLII